MTGAAVLEPIHQVSASPAQNRILPAPDGQPADIIELVMAEHRRIIRLGHALDDAVRGEAGSGPGWMLAHVWQRLTDVLEAHTRAEEEICYLSMFGAGKHGAWRAAVAGDDDIREAISEAALRRPGSAQWWRAVRAGTTAAARHIEQTEGDALVRWQLSLTMSQRRELGRQWSAFMAAWAHDGAARDNRDLPAYGVPPAGRHWRIARTLVTGRPHADPVRTPLSATRVLDVRYA
ncbi:MAG TPA: hemerythrin domain-containing protein [Streptosporangiaceae bacterium]|nr:hemerythrin domain-containing protein [Streptosporangiaceae bacterium]